jgi:hypothetical protein
VTDHARDPHLTGLMEQIADRLEGKPAQKLQQPVPHATYFYKAGGPTPREVEAADHAASNGVTSSVAPRDQPT